MSFICILIVLKYSRVFQNSNTYAVKTERTDTFLIKLWLLWPYKKTLTINKHTIFLKNAQNCIKAIGYKTSFLKSCKLH